MLSLKIMSRKGTSWELARLVLQSESVTFTCSSSIWVNTHFEKYTKTWVNYRRLWGKPRLDSRMGNFNTQSHSDFIYAEETIGEPKHNWSLVSPLQLQWRATPHLVTWRTAILFSDDSLGQCFGLGMALLASFYLGPHLDGSNGWELRDTSISFLLHTHSWGPNP